MKRLSLDELPSDHRRLPQNYVFAGTDEHGTDFELRIWASRRRASSSNIVKAQMRAMSRGRPLGPSDLYDDVLTISLRLPGRREDIQVNPNGTYGVGRKVSRSLREIVAYVLRENAPEPPKP